MEQQGNDPPDEQNEEDQDWLDQQQDWLETLDSTERSEVVDQSQSDVAKFRALRIIRASDGTEVVQGQIGQGALFVVKRAQEHDEQEVAAGVRKQLDKETAILGMLDSAYIVRLHEADTLSIPNCLQMEWLPGVLLTPEQSPMAEKVASYYFAQLMLVIDHMHSRGVIHHSISPSTLLLNE